MAEIKGGEAFREALRRISEGLSSATAVRVGFLEGAKYGDGTPVAMVAAIQEFGAPAAGIPPRPYFRSMVAAKSPGWGEALGQILPAVDYDAAAALTQMGEGIAGQLRQSIADTMSPPLSPVTLMLRKMRAENPDLVVTARTVGEAARRVAAGESYGGAPTKPLVDTGHLLGSVDYEVKVR